METDIVKLFKLSNADIQKIKGNLLNQWMDNIHLPPEKRGLISLEDRGKVEVEKEWEQSVKELNEALQLFLERLNDTDKNVIIELVQRASQEGKELSDEEFVKIIQLEDLAKKELSTGNLENARLMFVFLTTLFPFYSTAWVGYALTEQDLGNIDKAKDIFSLAMELFNHEPTIHIPAAKFFINLKENEKASTILNNLNNSINNPNISKEIESIINLIK